MSHHLLYRGLLLERLFEMLHLSAVRIEGGAAAALAGERPEQADDLIIGLVTDTHVE